MGRRPRNVISRDRAMSLRAADLLDDGLTDAQAHAALKEEFPDKRFSPRTVGSFRHADYAEVRNERLRRRDAAEKVKLLMGAADGEAGTYAEAGQALLAKLMYDALTSAPEELDGKSLASMGKTLSKIRELDIKESKIEMEKERFAQAERIKRAAGKKDLSVDDLGKEVDRIMGIA